VRGGGVEPEGGLAWVGVEGAGEGGGDEGGRRVLQAGAEAEGLFGGGGDAIGGDWLAGEEEEL
jgi:hypothetical protein